MNNHDDEATQYITSLDESTQIVVSSSQPSGDKEIANPMDNQNPSKKGRWTRAAMGAGSGLLIGGIATMMMGMKNPDKPGKNGEGNHKEDLSHPEWVDDDIAVATSVNDEMSFGEAFAAARAEVGPGGCFEWHGNIYGTYTADEWNNMTAEQRAEWSDHFSWNHLDHSQSNVAQHSTSVHHSASGATPQNDDVEIVSVNHSENNTVQNQTNVDYHTSDEVFVQSAEPEIEILGVVHDDETGTNIGGMTVDGQDVILIDVDNDLAFDYMATDVNGDGQLEQGEFVDIQGQNLTVNDLGGFSNPAADLYASSETPDYSNDVYEG